MKVWRSVTVVSLKPLRPLPCSVDDGDDGELIADDGVGDDVGGAGDDKLTGAGHAPWPAKMRRGGYPPHGRVKCQDKTLGGSGIVLFDVLARMGYVCARPW